MDKAFINKMEEELKAQQTKLRGELSSFADENKKNEDDYNTRFPSYGDKDEENATEVADFQDNLSLERNLEKTLGEIDVALGKIKKGTYGKCSKCDVEIDVARLEAFPAATRCMECNKAAL